MNISEKIMKLRKEKGWSQEDLASELDISRQSISKWENGTAIPDADKVIRLSELFHVSTDYLLKDTVEQDGSLPEDHRRMVMPQDAYGYLETIKDLAKPFAFSIQLYVLSPVVMFLLIGLSQMKPPMLSEDMAGGLGVVIILLFVAIATGRVVTKAHVFTKYQYLEEEEFILDLSCKTQIEKESSRQREGFYRKIALGVILCIMSAVPLLILAAMNAQDAYILFCVGLLLLMVSFGVFLFVEAGLKMSSYDKLLQINDYSPKKKEANKKIGSFAGIYWCVVTAGYLAYSFITLNWQHSVIVFPVAGVLFAALCQWVEREKK